MKFFLFSCMFLILACTNPATESGSSKLAPDAFAAMLKSNPDLPLIDVRTPEEFQSGHIAGARNWNINDGDLAIKAASLDKLKPVLVYCKVGGRSQKAADQLVKAGFVQVIDLKGGFDAWKASGMPVE